MAKIGFVFSGQGAQYKGMGKELYDKYEEVKNAFDRGNDILGYSISDICFNGDESLLNRTDITQPAIFILSAGIANILKNKGIKADVTCGLSLGEYTSLYYSEAIEFEDTVKVLKKRGEIMNNSYPEGKGGMTAVIGLKIDTILSAIEDVKEYGTVEVANLNCPGQIVVSGEVSALEKIEEIFKEKKAIKIARLDVSGPFHTSLLKNASNEFKSEVEGISFKNMELPVISNYTGDIIEKELIVDTLVNQMCNTVKFESDINKMIEMGVDTFIEIGPSKVLSGFIKRINRKAKILNVECEKSLENVLESIL